MERRHVIKLLAITASGLPVAGIVGSTRAATPATTEKRTSVPPLPYRVGTRIPVAFVLGPGAEVVDFAGPWGVFEYAYLPELDGSPFELFTVAESTTPLSVSGGMTIVPNHAFADAPQPRLIVVPAMEPPSAALLDWLRRMAPATDLTMSVCNGALVLASAGLLAGKQATAHHGAYALFQADFPEVTVKRGARFVDDGGVSTSGGLTSGIDLALHVVNRYFGEQVAEQTATALEYQGRGWRDPESNAAFAKKPVSTPEHPICPVCEMEVEKRTALQGTFRGRRYYFCSDMDQKRFNQTPERFVDG